MRVLTVALTGGIATGKSVVASVLRRRGFTVDSADLLARGLMSPGRKAWREITRRFGTSILNPDRTIDRPKLAAVIFGDEAERRFVNSVVHPLVLAEKRKTVRRLEKSGRDAIYVSEAALTLEAGFAAFYDRIVVTDCPRRLQVRRLMERSGLSLAEARKRVRAQLPRAARLRQAEYVIDTSGTLERTIEQSEEVADRLTEDGRLLLAGKELRGGRRRLTTGGRRRRAAP